MEKIEIRTRDGSAPSYVWRNSGANVLLYMDGIGIRPAMFEIAERIAKNGYFVLMPDVYYRSGPYEPMDAKTVFADAEKRQVLMEKFMAPASVDAVMSDTKSFLDFFPSGKIGTTGFCMGGRMSLAAAGTFPDRIAVASAFHPGRIAMELAPSIKARVYIARASEDPTFTDEMLKTLEAGLAKSGAPHVIETYPAKHGWVPTDTPVHDPAQAERAWNAMLDLFATL